MNGGSLENGGLADVFGQIGGLSGPAARREDISAVKPDSCPETGPARQEDFSVERKKPERCAKPPSSPQRPRTAAPFSLRLTPEEREHLDRLAGGKPLGAYIRDRLLGESATKRRVSRKPKADDEKIARLLAQLGRSRLSGNLNQLAKAVHTGTLSISREGEQELLDACRAVSAMREDLLAALGLKS